MNEFEPCHSKDVYKLTYKILVCRSMNSFPNQNSRVIILWYIVAAIINYVLIINRYELYSLSQQSCQFDI